MKWSKQQTDRKKEYIYIYTILITPPLRDTLYLLFYRVISLFRFALFFYFIIACFFFIFFLLETTTLHEKKEMKWIEKYTSLYFRKRLPSSEFLGRSVTKLSLFHTLKELWIFIKHNQSHILFTVNFFDTKYSQKDR